MKTKCCNSDVFWYQPFEPYCSKCKKPVLTETSRLVIFALSSMVLTFITAIIFLTRIMFY